MAFLFFGGEFSALLASDSNSVETTNGGTFNSAFARCSMRASAGGGAANYLWADGFAMPDEFYVHVEGGRGTSAATSATFLELRSASTALFRILSTDTALQMQRWTGTVWTNVGASVTASMTDRQEVDLYIDGNTASGTATLYVGGNQRTTAAVDLSLVTAIAEARSYGIDSAAGHFISQMVLADEPTIGMRLATVSPSGAGSTGDWTSDYTSVDEIVLNDGDFVYSSTNGQVELYTGSVPSLSGYVVRAVGVYVRSKRGAAGLANLQLALRVNGANYFSSSKAQGVGFDTYGAIWEENPDTTDPWLTSEITALQFGMKAIT